MTIRSYSDLILARMTKVISYYPKWWAIIPLSVSMGIIYSTGPQLQSYIVALITGDETSIYGSSFRNEQVRLPDLNDWFGVSIHWPHPCIGLIVFFLSVKSSSVKSIFLNTCLFGFLTLTFFDFIYEYLYESLSVSGMFENIVANFVGSIGAASLFIVIFELADYGFRSFDWGLWPRRGIAASLFLLGSILAMSGIFYLTDFFYRPRPSSIELIAEAPSGGFLIAKEAQKSDRRSDTENNPAAVPFSLISQAKESSGLNWRLPDHAKISTAISKEEWKYDIEVSLFIGCLPGVKLVDLPAAKSPFTISGARTFSVWHDWGVWDATVVAEKGYGTSQITGPDAFFYSLDRNSDGKGLDIHQAISGFAQVTYSGESRSLDIFVVASPGKPDEVNEALPRLHVQVDGVDYSIESRSSLPENSVEKVPCLSVPTRNAFKRKRLDLGKSSLLGARLRISPSPKMAELPTNAVTLTGDGGWVTVMGAPPESLDTVGSNHIDMITLSGKIKSVTVDGDDRDPKDGDTYTAISGDIKGSLVSGLLKVTGNAEILWENDSRANRTKWESITIEYRVILITAIFSALVWVVRRVSLLVSGSGNIMFLEEKR